MTKEELKSRVKQLEAQREDLLNELRSNLKTMESNRNGCRIDSNKSWLDGRISVIEEVIKFIENQKQMDLLKRPGTLYEDPNQNPHSKYKAKTTTITKEVNKRGKV